MNKLATVAAFVMDGVNRITAGDWDGIYDEADYPDLNRLSNYGQVAAANIDGHGFDLWFGGEVYRVQVSKVRRVK